MASGGDMTPVEFVKKFGWDAAKDLASRSKTSIGYLSVDHHELDQGELQRYVDAYDLVQTHGGINGAKSQVFLQATHNIGGWSELQKAITLVEQCND